MMNRTRRKNFCGFTLIELLVVVAIISLLIAILMPSLSAARNTAGRVKCGSNLRQIGVAIQAYVSEFNGVYPFAAINGPAMTPPIVGYWSWDDLLDPYMNGTLTRTEQESDGTPVSKRIKMLLCPMDNVSVGRSYSMTNPTDGGKGGSLGLGISRPQSSVIGTENERWTITTVESPTSTLAMTEWPNSSNMVGKVWGAAIRNPWSQTQTLRPHGEFSPYLFVDGHVEIMKPEQTIRNPLTQWGQYSNGCGIWTVNPGD